MWRSRTASPTTSVFVTARIDLLTALAELGSFCSEACLDLGVLLLGELAHLFRDLHRAELGTTHRAEVRTFGSGCGQRLVVKVLCGVGVEREVELILPAEL